MSKQQKLQAAQSQQLDMDTQTHIERRRTKRERERDNMFSTIALEEKWIFW